MKDKQYARAQEPDLQGCESCDKELPIEQMTSMEDCWFCPECVAEFQKAFDACDHRWKPHTSTMGEPGRVCERCSGFVADEDAAIVASRQGERLPMCEQIEEELTLGDILARATESKPARCALCGNLMPEGEEMFRVHGFSGPCPASPLARTYGGGQTKLREELLEVLRAASQFALRYDRSSPLHVTLNKGFALLGDDSRWNGPTGQNNED